MNFPNFEPSTLPAGEYQAEIISDPVEKTSQFDQSKTYLELQMNLQNPRGEHFSYTWTFNKKTPIYKDLLLLLGGKEHLSGMVTPPASMQGRRFAISLTERQAKNDKTRLVNDIIRVKPHEPEPEQTQPEKIPAEDGVEVPF